MHYIQHRLLNMQLMWILFCLIVTPTYFLEQTADLYDIFPNTKDTNKCINDILEEFEMIELCKQLYILEEKQCHYNENHQPNGLILQRRINQMVLFIL